MVDIRIRWSLVVSILFELIYPKSFLLDKKKKKKKNAQRV